MSLPSAGVRSDFRRFKELKHEIEELENKIEESEHEIEESENKIEELEHGFEELNSELDELEEEFSALNLSLPLQLGDLQNLETIATNLVDAINELLMQIKEKTSYGVVSGLTVTAQDTPDMTVNVSSGIIYMQNGDRFEVDTDVITIDTADTTNARKDIIYVNSTGKITYLAGTAAEIPEAPSTPTGGLILAEIAVAANTTAIETSNITDKKKSILN